MQGTKIYYKEEIDGVVREIALKCNKADMTIDVLLDELIRPLLLSIGYHTELVDEYLGEM